jgi:hypothetical protein
MLARLSATGIAALLLLLVAFAPVVHAAGGSLYVDGKTGSDSNGGHSAGDAFKTIYKAAAMIPHGSAAAGWTVVVKGYTDYIYRERAIPPGWDGRGTASAPVVFQASGYKAASTTGYVKPIVSGADVAPKSGQRWVPSGTANVWKTPWPVRPSGYGTYSGSLRTALFQDKTRWLWEQSSMADLAARASSGRGGYLWSGGYLYATAIGTKDPSAHSIDVVMRAAFLFMGTEGVDHVQVRGFDVRHSANGIAMIKGVDYGTIADNVVTANLLMGIAVSGGQTASGPDPSTGMMIARNRGSANTLQMIKVDEGTQSATVCNNVATGNGLQGIKVQGPPKGSAYTGTTSGITVCRNTLSDNDYNPTGSTYNNTSGLTIANGARNVTVDSNTISGNEVGIHITQEATGRPRMDGIALKRNEISGNRRFGIYFFDGANGSSGGAGSMRSDYDVLWNNGTGIGVARGSTNKTISHATVHGSVGDGVKIGESGQTAASATIRDSLITGSDGYGLWLVTGSKATLSYVGFYDNLDGHIKGSPGRTGTNTKPPGYLSMSPSNASFLRISTTSYQYTAGHSGGPIGARY